MVQELNPISAIIFLSPTIQTKGVGEGTGMGLAMVKGIVESWGGQITVRSDPHKKTTFTVILPISTSRDHTSSPQLESDSLGTEHILFVDDEPPIARMGSRILESITNEHRIAYKIENNSILIAQIRYHY